MPTLVMDIVRPQVHTTKLKREAAGVVVTEFIPSSEVEIAKSLFIKLFTVTFEAAIAKLRYFSLVIMWIAIDLVLVYGFVVFLSFLVSKYL